MKRIGIKIGILSAAILLIGATAVWYHNGSNGDTAAYQTSPATCGDILVTISAIGTVEPQEVIDVGAQIAGQILSFCQDVAGHTVDYGSQVAKGTVPARIDDSVYTADAANAKA
jgi:HlyD family secretion protein